MQIRTTLEQVYEYMEHGVYDFTKDGECTGCGACCSNYLPLNTKEIKEIKSYIKKKHIKEHRHNFPTSRFIKDGTCPFLNEGKENQKCEIYSVRPKICRVFICNQPPSKVKENKERFWKTRKPCDMRETFFD